MLAGALLFPAWQVIATGKGGEAVNPSVVTPLLANTETVTAPLVHTEAFNPEAVTPPLVHTEAFNAEAVTPLLVHTEAFNALAVMAWGSVTLRSTTLPFTGKAGQDRYPGYNISPVAPDKSGVESSATELAAKIRLGWNLGNALEATGGETGWHNPVVTPEMIDLVHRSGFNAIRIPCSWNQHVEDQTTAKIKASWLARVREVVTYCTDRDMYVVLNIHWDGGWLENHCTPERQEENNARLKAFWEQIATALRDFDEHLIFAGSNEPNVENEVQMAVLDSYHQTFVNAVRSTGGKNHYRVLVIQGPSTDIMKTRKLMTRMPDDKVKDRLMAEIHYYTPWNFCGLTRDESWGKMFYYWGKDFHSATDPGRNATWGEEEAVDTLFAHMKAQFVDRGIPVIMGEYSVSRRSGLEGEALERHLASRAWWLNYTTRKAIENGIIPFYWDNGGTGRNGCALFDRKNLTVFDQQALDAITRR
ncbi:MAG TPA: glycoside hydrolase family 5 protein [Prolixibacteraceae bacterium]|nr:glycoside hydrolase family 5 protein [Prolixibacteraceae bacterium]